MAAGIPPGSSKGGDITTVTAGDGLSGGGTSGATTLTLDLNELTAAAVADGDFIPIIDTNDSNGSRKEAVADLATLLAGSGLTATNSVIAVDTLNQDTTGTAAIATTVTITDNESTNEDNAIIFTAGGDVDGGNIGLESDGTLTYNPSTGKITATGFIGAVTGDVTGTSSKATVTDSTANTNFPVVFHDESDALLDDTGALRYNPSTGQLLVPNLTVAGTTTTVDTVTMEAANAVIFEGATADGYETTLSVVDPTADHTQYLINQGGYIPLLAASTTTAISATPAELNYNDTGAAVGTVVASKTVTVDSNKDVASFRNITLTGELDAGTLDLSSSADIAGDLVLSGGADGALQFTNAGENSIKIPDNQASALIIEEADNAYITFVTTNSSEAITVAKATTFSDDVTMTADKSLNFPQGANITFTDQILDNSIDDDDAQGIIFTFRAGATVTPFSPVYLDTNNEVQECDADAIATMPCIGVSTNTSDVSADADCPVMLLGLIRDDDFAFGTAGAPLYVSTTVGTMSNTAPSGDDDVVQIVGHSIADDAMFVQPSLTYLVVDA